MTFSSVQSAYVHVPFCIHRCGYCDFTVIAGRDDLMETYLECLEREISSKLPAPQPMQTLFLGGGTPSYLPPDELRRLFEILRKWLPLKEGAEFSMECNPDGLTEDKVAVIAESGVNRISLGVQSFDAQHLKTLERTHAPADVEVVMKRLRAYGMKNVSMDLIFGIPDQTLSEWKETLQAAIALQPNHVSAYGLTYEKGTNFWTRLQKDELQATPEELEREMYAHVMSFLPEHGYQQYELSNFAQSGFESQHNRVYWEAKPFWGFGPGAAEFIDGVRRKNSQSVTRWIAKLSRGDSPIEEVDELDTDLQAREAVMVGLRQVEGISLSEYEQKFGCSPQSLAPSEYQKLLNQNLLEVRDGFLRLTLQGRFLADTVMSEFF